MKTWYVVIVALFLLGWDLRATHQEAIDKRSVPPGPVPRALRLLPQGAVFSADGKLLLTGYAVENVPQRPFKAPSLVLWEVETGKKLWGAEDTQNLEPLGFLADGKTALVRDYNHGRPSLQVWDIVKGQRVSAFPRDTDEVITCASLSHSGKRVLIARHLTKNDATHLELWDATPPKLVQRFGKINSTSFRIHFSPDDRLVLTVSAPTDREPDTVILWDLDAARAVHGFPRSRYPGHLTGFFPDGRRAFCARREGQGEGPRLGIWEVSTGKEVAQLVVPSGATTAFATDNAYLLFSGPQTLSYIDCARGQIVWSRNPANNGEFLWSSAVARNKKLAFTGCGSIGIAPRDSNSVPTGGGWIKLTLWDLEKGKPLRDLSDPGLTK